jgi:hypothetical protein
MYTYNAWIRLARAACTPEAIYSMLRNTQSFSDLCKKIFKYLFFLEIVSTQLSYNVHTLDNVFILIRPQSQ